MKLSAIHVYPIKSVAGLLVSSAEMEARGLRHDRRWMIVDSTGRFVTGRQLPKMVLIQALPSEKGLHLNAPGMLEHAVHIPKNTADRIDVRVWDDQVSAILADAETNVWLSSFLNLDLRLVYMDEISERRVEITPPHAPEHHAVSFADGYPLLLISEASLANLNKKLEAPISMLRFRPNLVVTADEAHVEDSWKRIRIGAVEFEFIKTCTRCVFTTVDPLTGEKDPSGEPLRTLKSYRRSEAGILFGMNAVAKNNGKISVGDDVTVLL
jgi:uncharacterized protein